MIEPQFKITSAEEKETFGRFTLEPLAPGYGHTLGAPLRRVLLRSLKGSAVTAVKIAGVQHQFSTLPGVKEDMVEIILQIKKLRLKHEGEGPVKMKLNYKGEGEVRAGQIEPQTGVTVVNKDLLIATLTSSKAKLDIEFWVEEGYGYSPFEDRKTDELGVIAIDAVFSPVTRVNYKVESTRVGRMTDLDKLIIEITTDGTIMPSEGLKQAAQILFSYFHEIYSPRKETVADIPVVSPVSEEVIRMTIEEIDLPTRIINALKNGGVETVGDLITMDPQELVKIKNLGTKSLQIIEEKLKEKGVAIRKE